MASPFNLMPAAQTLRTGSWFFLHITLLLVVGCYADSERAWAWDLPPGFPVPKVPSDNPMSAAKVELGRYLFYDRRLSNNQSQSCADCHLQSKAFTDGLPRAIGSTGQVARRGAMSLQNVAYMTSYTWASPVILTLEQQAMIPLFGTHPTEMSNSDINLFLAPLVKDPRYVALFKKAFPSRGFAGDKALTLNNVVRAIACFERTIISGRSPYDDYTFGGNANALSPSAVRGATLFFSEKTECNHCHSGFNLVDAVQNANTQQAAQLFHNTGLYNINGQGSFPAADGGVINVTGMTLDMGRFRAQSMRNIMITAPYFHDGSAQDMNAVIAHYAAGGRTIATGPYRGNGAKSPLKSQFMVGFTLSPQEHDDLFNFFNSLTDTQFLQDPNLSNPFKDGPNASIVSPPTP